MSILRYNEKELLAYAASRQDNVIKGSLKKVSTKSKSKYLYVVVKSNLLFVYKSSKEPSPGDSAHRCYVLEECYPELTETGFKIVFHESVKTSFIEFICPPDQAKIWVQAIKEANFKFLRNCIMYYNSILNHPSNQVNDQNSFNKVAILIKLRGFRIPQTDSVIHIEIFDDKNELMIKSGNIPFDSNEMVFNECLILNASGIESTIDLDIVRTNSISQQTYNILVHSFKINPSETFLRNLTNDVIKPMYLPIDIASASGMLIVSAVLVDETLTKITKQSNHRSSCLFSDSIQPLPLHKKELLFSDVFECNSGKYFVINNPILNDEGKVAPLKIIHESVIKLSNNSKITVKFLEFLLHLDMEAHDIISHYINKNDEITNIQKLEFRIDVNKQHKKCLEDVFDTIQRHTRSLKKSGYQTLYYPTHLALYRAEIMDSNKEHYEIFDKIMMSTPAKHTDGFADGGLYSILCDNQIKSCFTSSKTLIVIKDKILIYKDQLNDQIHLMAKSLANSNLDQLARHFMDFEAIAHSLMTHCAKSEVADMILQFAEALGKESPTVLYAWLEDRIVVIDQSWSVASNIRDLQCQLEALSKVQQEFIEDYKSEMWVEYMFVPCNKFQRNLNSLVTVANAALQYKIHKLQNVNIMMNRFVMRCDAVISQLISGIITTVYSSIFVYMDDVFFWLQLLNVGFFVQLECLLSCKGVERLMFEDVYIACEMLKSYKIEVVCKDEDTTLPAFSGSRYNLLISIPVPTKVYALLLDVCQGHSNRKISLIPIMCNQTINSNDIQAYSDSEFKFNSTVNSNSLEYVRKLLERNKVFYKSIEDTEKLIQIKQCLDELQSFYDDDCTTNPSKILPKFQMLGKLLCAGQMVMCGNGVDDTAMSISQNLTSYLKTNYSAPDDNKLVDSLRQGALLERTKDIRSHAHFKYCPDKFCSLFPEYRPPSTTCNYV